MCDKFYLKELEILFDKIKFIILSHVVKLTDVKDEQIKNNRNLSLYIIPDLSRLFVTLHMYIVH